MLSVVGNGNPTWSLTKKVQNDGERNSHGGRSCSRTALFEGARLQRNRGKSVWRGRPAGNLYGAQKTSAAGGIGTLDDDE